MSSIFFNKRRSSKIWTIGRIKNGFQKFFDEYGRYPTVLEIDAFKDLPSARQLQRRWSGGVPQLRKELGLSVIDFTKGKQRSKTASLIGKRGRDKEREIYNILVNRFGEIAVHAQKPFNDYVGRFDFFVYAKQSFAIDVFYPESWHSFVGCLNNKMRTYKNVNLDIILLQMNCEIPQDQMDKFIVRKKNKLLSNIKVLNYDNFLEYIKKIEPLKILQ